MNREERMQEISDILRDYDDGEYYSMASAVLDWADKAALRGWIKTTDRLPEGDEHDEILGLYKGPDYLLYDIVQLGWLRLHPEMYPYWTNMPQKPEANA